MSKHHNTLPPSSFPALQHCSHFLSSGLETPQNARGTRIHGTTAHMLRGEAETLWLKDAEEFDACQWLAEKTREELREIAGIEERLEIRDPLSGELITFGTADCHGTNAQFSLPGLVDWKSGKEGTYLPQLKIYALALMDHLNVKEVVATVMYCDSKAIERWMISIDEAESLLRDTIAAQRDPNSPYVTGIYCRGCRLRDTCPAWLEPSTNALVTIGSDLAGQIERGLEHVKSDPVVLGKFIHGWRKLEKLVEHADLTKKGIEYAEAGAGMENWDVQVRKGRSHFTRAAVLALLQSGLPDEALSKVLKIDSAELEKLTGKLGAQADGVIPFLPKYQLPDYKALVYRNGDAK